MSAPVAVVSGGTRGIGLAFTRRLTKLGYRVAALYRGDDSAARAAATELGGALLPLRVDLTDPQAVELAVARLLADLGAPRVLVNNAGRNVDRPFLSMTVDEWRTVLDTNLSSAFYLTRALAPAMIAAGHEDAVIVNVGATTGIRPRLNGVNYCASKAGLLQMTKCLALELAPAVRVNCLIPGMTETEELVERFSLDEEASRAAVVAEIPQRRVGTVDDIADALEFLIGAGSRYMTGQKVIVDGGQFMW